ncbi:hypothetical protein JR316_0009804 [Psilocybe cubensis]|nr:hypothetical protein JR316_0009804 [Psilocybe cubensis]KAH9477582.1 hypothetical protein JR316_0009804 [Psilocybe cubensis]
MIVEVPEGGDSKSKAGEATSEPEPELKNEAPPPYMDPQEGTSTIQSSSRALPDIKPSNFVCLSRQNDSIKGSWIIDPTMIIPSAFLPSLTDGETEETRGNISLMSRNGSIQAEIFVLPGTSNDDSRRLTNRKQTIIRSSSANGTITLKIHEVASRGSRLPLQIKAFSANGSLNIYIPRSFQGPVSVSLRNGSLRYSESVRGLVTQFSELNGAQRSFIGDFDANAIRDAGDWAGDAIWLESRNGSIKVFFDDELDETPRQKSSFLGKLFGF